ncbi:MAG: hypothetical protein R3F59_30800 [Myxococcota bacterium]
MLLLVALACATPPATAPPATETPASPTVPPTPAPAPSASPDVGEAPAGLVDRVWEVTQSDGVAEGTLYTFLSDGTLVIRHGEDPPGVGSWAWADGQLTMTEEGVPYPTDVTLQNDQLSLVSHNPGGELHVTLAPAPDEPLPTRE